MWTDWEKKVDTNATIPPRLLWDMDLKNFDYEKCKSIVVQRVIEYGTPEDYYTLFRMYNGVKGVRKIIKRFDTFAGKEILISRNPLSYATANVSTGKK